MLVAMRQEALVGMLIVVIQDHWMNRIEGNCRSIDFLSGQGRGGEVACGSNERAVTCLARFSWGEISVIFFSCWTLGTW